VLTRVILKEATFVRWYDFRSQCQIIVGVVRYNANRHDSPWIRLASLQCFPGQ